MEFGLKEWRMFSMNEDRISVLLELPYHPQLNDYSCGSACLKMVGEFYHGKSHDEFITSRLPIPSKDHGLSGSMMFEGLKNLTLDYVKPASRKVNRSIKAVLKFIDLGFPVIMAFGDSTNETSSHYAVLVGYSNKYFYFHDPFLRPYFPRSRRTFTKMWNRENKWYVAVFPKVWAE